MKLNIQKVIGGKCYDTSDASLIGCIYSGRRRGDFRWLREGLYKSRRGEFFLAGQGGPSSKWVNDSVAGGGLKILTEEEAMVWAQQNNVPSFIIKQHFGKLESEVVYV